MLSLLYSLFIWIYRYSVSIASISNNKAKTRIRGLKQQESTINADIQKLSKKRVLIHCSSLGEYEQARPIIRKILFAEDFDIIISFFSPSGYVDAQIDNPSRTVKCYLPFDDNSKMIEFIDQTNPSKVIIIKNEWWWNMLTILENKGTPTYLVSSSIRADHYFIKYPILFFKKRLNAFNKIYTVDDQSADLLSNIYSGELIVSGDTRVDQVRDIKQGQSNSSASDISAIIYGSIWLSDLHIIKQMISEKPAWKHILYPHDLSDQNIINIQKEISGITIVDKIEKTNDPGIYLISSMGALKTDYRHASLAYIGGGFGDGIHNILEAAVYEIPIAIGPRYNKSLEVVQLISEGCVFPVSKTEDTKKLIKQLNDQDTVNEIRVRLKTYFSVSKSATEIIYSSIFE